MENNFQIVESKGDFLILKARNLDIADRFEDYLSEELDIEYNVKLELDCELFYFDKTMSISHINSIIHEFEKSKLK
jgi:hypothetical protein